jgi:hypothetical protein
MIKMHVKPEVVISEIHKLIMGIYFLLSATLILWRMNSLNFFFFPPYRHLQFVPMLFVLF